MWETLHLFSRYTKATKVKTTSSNDATVSGYSTVNSSNDSMTVILVNRDLGASRTATVNLTGFAVANGSYKVLELSSLPSNETFISHTSNALKSKNVSVSGNSFSITLPALSTTAVILKGALVGIDDNPQDSGGLKSLSAYPNPTSGKFKIHLPDQISGKIKLKFTDLDGNIVFTSDAENNSEINLSGTGLESGLYIITADYQCHLFHTKLVYTGGN